ncbi:MAG: hypothetical protein RJA09_1778 [Pseudomonadota bacterium]
MKTLLRWLHWRHWLLPALGVVACLAVFRLYQHPSFVVDLADRLWACF